MAVFSNSRQTFLNLNLSYHLRTWKELSMFLFCHVLITVTLFRQLSVKSVLPATCSKCSCKDFDRDQKERQYYSNTCIFTWLQGKYSIDFKVLLFVFKALSIYDLTTKRRNRIIGLWSISCNAKKQQ